MEPGTNFDAPEAKDENLGDVAPGALARTTQGRIDALTRTLDGMQIRSDGSRRMDSKTAERLSKQIGDVEESVRYQANQLKELRAILETAAEDSNAEESEEDEDENDALPETGKVMDKTNASTDPPTPPQRSTSEMKFARWSFIRRALKEPIHPAFYVLVGNITEHEFPASRHMDERRDDVEGISQKLPEGQFEQPEFIMFKSRILMVWLRWNIDDSNLGYDPQDIHMHYMIERPFKLLVYGASKIRNGLSLLEEYRRKTYPITEEDYDAGWRADPPLDNISDGEIDPSNLTLLQLTGLIKDIRTLVKFMDHFIVPLEMKESYERVYFSELWYAFPLGSLIYIKDRNIPQKVWKVLQRLGASPFPMILPDGSRSRSRLCPFVIDCYYIDFDGNRYFPVYKRITIEPFHGQEKSTDLIACPLEVAKASGLVDEESLVARGRDFISLTRPTHRDYTGRNQLEEPDGKLLSDQIQGRDDVSLYSEWIDSEVMVDIERAFQGVRAWRLSDSEPPQVPERDYEDIPAHWTCHFDRYWDIRVARRLMTSETDKWQKWNRDHPPTNPEDLLLLPGRVFGFVFQTRRWSTFSSRTNVNGANK